MAIHNIYEKYDKDIVNFNNKLKVLLQPGS